MKKVCFFDTKPYDKIYFEPLAKECGMEMVYCESKLNEKSVVLAAGCDAVVAFVNDRVNAPVIASLEQMGIKIVALRCAGYNNVDFKEAYGKTVNEFIVDARMERARQLLLNGSEPIYAVAESVGIDNHTYFCKLFKRKNGITPNRYRMSK